MKGLRERTLPRDLLIIGPAGTGKTWGVLDFLHCLCRDNRNLRILIARDTRAALTESVLVTYEQEILPLDGMQRIARGTQRKFRHSYRYPSGSEIMLGGLDDADRVLSTAWDFAFVNEVVRTQLEDYETLRSRMNRPGRRSRFGYLLADTNPGHPDHWMKKRVDAGLTRAWETWHQANPAMFDGKDWTEDGRIYLDESLGVLTGTRRLRLLLGLWAVGEGVWFDSFDQKNIDPSADYDPNLPYFMAIDPGVFTGAVFFQVRTIVLKNAQGKSREVRRVSVFADYLSENLGIGRNAQNIKQLCTGLTGRMPDEGYCDPAGTARTDFGLASRDEYAKHEVFLRPWSAANPSVADSLANVEAAVSPVGMPPLLVVHPRCQALINAFRSYERAKVGKQWADFPKDPQHPHEDVIDALRGGMWARVRNVVDRVFLGQRAA